MAAGRKTGGRTKGTPNKMTAVVKDLILTALDKAGGVDYLVAQAAESPAAFLTLVGKVLPLQVEASGPDGGPQEHVHRLERAEELVNDWVSRGR